MAHSTERLSVCCFQIELEYKSVVFCGMETTGETEAFGGSLRSNNKVNPVTTPDPAFEPGQHKWEASGLTAAPSLLP